MKLMKADNLTEKRLHTGFIESAARYPEAIALSIGDQEFTYSEVEDKARLWAGALSEACHEMPGRIGIFAYRSTVSYIGVLASLFAGAAFVPLNPTFPVKRTCSMIKLADLDAIIVDEASCSKFMAVIKELPEIPVILLPDSDKPVISGIGAEVTDQCDLRTTTALRNLPVIPSDAYAYLLFTSGSTGQPKGVPILHANVVHFLDFNQRRYQLTNTDHLTQTFDQTFDLSVFDLFMAWGAGACVCAIQPIQLLSPFRFVREKNITVWFSVPSVISLLRKTKLLKPGSLPNIRWSLFCGEALTQDSAEAWQAAAPYSVVENLYGPTELTLACTVYQWHPLHSPAECVNGIVPIGRLYENLHALVMDRNLQPVLPRENGELCVAGPQTFPGYWNDPERTAMNTFTHLDQNGDNQLYYRTGDLVRLTESNNYVYIGRTDQQIQVMGNRVELGEIEAALCRCSGVAEAVALGWPADRHTCQGIIAFVSGNMINAESVITEIRHCLPAYMAPRTIHVLDAMPLNTNGKIDRKALYRKLMPTS